MAEIIWRVDDIDQNEDADTSVPFAFAGKDYEIDLCEANADQFRAEMEFWAEHARPKGKARKTITRTSAPSNESNGSVLKRWRTPDDADPVEAAQLKAGRLRVREWGKTHGFPSLGDRGVLPAALYVKYEQAHQMPADTDRHRAPEPDDSESDDTEQTELDIDSKPATSSRAKAPTGRRTAKAAS